MLADHRQPLSLVWRENIGEMPLKLPSVQDSLESLCMLPGAMCACAV